MDPFRDVPDLVGDFYRPGIGSSSVFRPVTTLPPMATGAAVLDVANNRLVYLDGTNTLLAPGNTGLGSSFVFFRALGGGLLTQTTNAQGQAGYFGLEQLTSDATSGTTTIDGPVDLLAEPGTVDFTEPVTGSMATSTPYTPRYSLMTNAALDAAVSAVGVSRIAAGGSPVPRDRVFFHHSYFDNVPIGGGGNGINRFTPGFEKLLDDDGNVSFEARFPFLATLDHDYAVNGSTSTSAVEFGNITLALKQVLARTDNWLVSGGLQVSLPTASDVSYQVIDAGQQREFLRIENESVHLMPFLGAVYAPNDRFFFQTMLQVDFDSNGKPVFANPQVLNGGTATQIGRLNSAAYLYADVGFGYWLFHEPDESTRTLTGFAPTFELHYLRNVSNNDSVAFQPLGSLGGRGDVETLTATVAGVFELNHQDQLSIGYSAPLSGGSDEPYDGELRIMFTRRFGPKPQR